jgi:selenocysteine lyase/cysteine desulfurase
MNWWGVTLDEKIQETRKKVLAFVGKSASEYTVAFTLNTTYGINLVLSQLPPKFKKIITADRDLANSLLENFRIKESQLTVLPHLLDLSLE